MRMQRRRLKTTTKTTKRVEVPLRGVGGVLVDQDLAPLVVGLLDANDVRKLRGSSRALHRDRGLNAAIAAWRRAKMRILALGRRVQRERVKVNEALRSSRVPLITALRTNNRWTSVLGAVFESLEKARNSSYVAKWHLELFETAFDYEFGANLRPWRIVPTKLFLTLERLKEVEDILREQGLEVDSPATWLLAQYKQMQTHLDILLAQIATCATAAYRESTVLVYHHGPRHLDDDERPHPYRHVFCSPRCGWRWAKNRILGSLDYNWVDLNARLVRADRPACLACLSDDDALCDCDLA